MKSKTKCFKCGSRRIKTSIIWRKEGESKSQRGIEKICLDCDTVICEPTWTFKDFLEECKPRSIYG